MKLVKETAPRGGARRSKSTRVARKALQGRPPGAAQARVDASLERQADEAADRAVRGETNVSRILTPAKPARYDAPASTGEPLDRNTRAEMESTFGADLAEVRIHKDGAAQAAARKEQAKAFTAGRDVYFGQGKYDPNGAEGKRLVAHEIAHVLQQTGRRVSTTLIVATARQGTGDIQMRGDEKAPAFQAAARRHGLELACARIRGAAPIDSDEEDEG